MLKSSLFRKIKNTFQIVDPRPHPYNPFTNLYSGNIVQNVCAGPLCTAQYRNRKVDPFEHLQNSKVGGRGVEMINLSLKLHSVVHCMFCKIQTNHIGGNSADLELQLNSNYK